MNRRCNKIKLISESGFLTKVPYKSTLVLTLEYIDFKFKFEEDDVDYNHYTLNMAELSLDPQGVIEGNRQLYGHLRSDYKYKSYFNKEELGEVDKIFNLASKEDFEIIDSNNVNDGDSLLIELYFDDGSKRRDHLMYGDISKDYGDLYDLLKLIDPLVPESEYKPEYFLFDD